MLVDATDATVGVVAGWHEHIRVLARYDDDASVVVVAHAFDLADGVRDVLAVLHERHPRVEFGWSFMNDHMHPVSRLKSLQLVHE